MDLGIFKDLQGRRRSGDDAIALEGRHLDRGDLVRLGRISPESGRRGG